MATSKLLSAIGILSFFPLFGGVITLVLPRTNFNGLASWEVRIMPLYGHAVGVIFLLIGADLAYMAL